MKKLFLNLVLFSLTALLSFAAAETTLSFFSINPEPTYIWSSPMLERGKGWEVHYIPNQTVKEWSIYEGQIEFENQIQTNNWGFVDPIDYISAKFKSGFTSYSFFGDSFTAAQGAQPWVPKLRSKLQREGRLIDIYNFGVLGTGFGNIYEILKNRSGQIDLNHLVFIVISDDFKRMNWRPLVKNNGVIFCPNVATDEICLEHRGPTAIIVDGKISNKELLKMLTPPDPKHKYWFQKTRLYRRTEKALDRKQVALDAHNREVYENSGMVMSRASMNLIKEIRTQLPNAEIDLIHIPERVEVHNRKYNLEIKDTIEKMGIRYHPALYDCRWSKDMFRRYDPHPNEKGYEALSMCVEKILFDEEKS